MNIIDTLNNNQKVKQFMETAALAAQRQKITAEEWEEGKKDLILLAMLLSTEVMNNFASEIYKKLRGL